MWFSKLLAGSVYTVDKIFKCINAKKKRKENKTGELSNLLSILTLKRIKQAKCQITILTLAVQMYYYTRLPLILSC